MNEVISYKHSHSQQCHLNLQHVYTYGPPYLSPSIVRLISSLSWITSSNNYLCNTNLTNDCITVVKIQIKEIFINLSSGSDEMHNEHRG